MPFQDVEKLFNLKLWQNRIKMEILITTREGHRAENELRVMKGEVQAYGEAAFIEIEEAFALQLQFIEAMISETEKLALPGKKKTARRKQP